MRLKLTAIAALAFAACASPPSGETASDYRFDADRNHVGRLYHYVRSNRDGALPEHIHVFHKSPTDVHVYKMVSRCTNAAYVTATLDYETWSPAQLVGGRLGRNADQIPFATLDYDRDSNRVEAIIELPDRTLTDALQLAAPPWRLYDFDFAEFTIFAQHLADYRRDFSVEMALLIADPSRPEFLNRLGDAKAIARGLDEARNAWRFDLAGAAFEEGGRLLLDAEDGHVVAVETAVPNHLEYDDFKLTLEGVEDGGEKLWRALLLSHFEGCPDD